MKHSNYNILLIILSITLFFALTKFSLSKQENFSVFAKLPLLGEIEVQNIKTDLSSINDKIKYSYNVSPTKIVDFFDDKINSGFILGRLENNNIVTEEYFFKTEKDDFKREIH